MKKVVMHPCKTHPGDAYADFTAKIFCNSYYVDFPLLGNTMSSKFDRNKLILSHPSRDMFVEIICFSQFSVILFEIVSSESII